MPSLVSTPPVSKPKLFRTIDHLMLYLKKTVIPLLYSHTHAVTCIYAHANTPLCVRLAPCKVNDKTVSL